MRAFCGMTTGVLRSVSLSFALALATVASAGAAPSTPAQSDASIQLIGR